MADEKPKPEHEEKLEPGKEASRGLLLSGRDLQWAASEDTSPHTCVRRMQ